MPEYVNALLNGVVTRLAAKSMTRAGDTNVWHPIVIPHQLTQQETKTAAGVGTTVSSPEVLCNRFGLQVKGTGAAATSWTVHLEGSLNGTQFSSILTHKSGVNGDGEMLWSPVPTLAKYFRYRVEEVTLGPATNLVIDIAGEAGT